MFICQIFCWTVGLSFSFPLNVGRAVRLERYDPGFKSHLIGLSMSSWYLVRLTAWLLEGYSPQ